jgi:hypothetical protein
MSYLKRIGPGSAFKMGALVYAVVGLIAGVFCSVIAFAAPAVHHAHMPWVSPSVSLFAVILCPIIYGIIGGIAAVISVLIFNLASRWAGGLEVEIN